MKKELKMILLIMLVAFGGASLLAPLGRIMYANSTAAKWGFSMYTFIFGGGTSKVNYTNNIGGLTAAWCFTVMALIVSVILLVLYFCKVELAKSTKVVLYSIVSGLNMVSMILDFCSLQLIGNTDGMLGSGAIITGAFCALVFLISLFMVYKTALSKDE